MKMFGWEVEEVIFDLTKEEKKDLVYLWWKVKVPENWHNDN